MRVVVVILTTTTLDGLVSAQNEHLLLFSGTISGKLPSRIKFPDWELDFFRVDRDALSKVVVPILGTTTFAD